MLLKWLKCHANLCFIIQSGRAVNMCMVDFTKRFEHKLIQQLKASLAVHQKEADMRFAGGEQASTVWAENLFFNSK